MTRPDLPAARHLLAALDLDAARDVPPHIVRTGSRSDALAADLRALLAAWDAAAGDKHPRRGDVYEDIATTWRHTVVAVEGEAVTLRQANGAQWETTRQRVTRGLRLVVEP